MKNSQTVLSKCNKMPPSAPLKLLLVIHALPAVPDIHMGINAGHHFYDFSQDCSHPYGLKFYCMQLAPAAGQVSKIIYNLQFRADAVALRKDGGRGEGEREKDRERERERGMMGSTTSVKLFGHKKMAACLISSHGLFGA